MLYFNSHGTSQPIHDFIELELIERDNYELREIAQWIVKYDIKIGDELIWVTQDPKMAWSYFTGDIYAEIKDEDIDESQLIQYDLTFEEQKANVILESDDGDDGYLLIIRGKDDADEVDPASIG